MGKSPKARYIVVDPNPPREAEKLIQAIIVEKLLAIKTKDWL